LAERSLHRRPLKSSSNSQGYLDYETVGCNPAPVSNGPECDLAKAYSYSSPSAAFAMSRRAIFRSDYGIFYSLTPTEAAGTISQTGYRTD
jgi:hypothetical protein